MKILMATYMNGNAKPNGGYTPPKPTPKKPIKKQMRTIGRPPRSNGGPKQQQVRAGGKRRKPMPKRLIGRNPVGTGTSGVYGGSKTTRTNRYRKSSKAFIRKVKGRGSNVAVESNM